MSQKKWAALLRGINVGGANKLPMAQLREVAEGLGWRDVQTYIASGNMVFTADGSHGGLAAALHDALKGATGLDLEILVLARSDVLGILNACPFAPEDPRQVHFFFLLSDPQPDDSIIARYKTASEQLEIAGRVAWFHTPEGFGRSELAGRLDRALGAVLTARNLRTVRKLGEMLA